MGKKFILCNYFFQQIITNSNEADIKKDVCLACCYMVGLCERQGNSKTK